MKDAELLSEIKAVLEIVLKTIEVAEKQNVTNIQTYYTLKDGLRALVNSIEQNGYVSSELYKRWESTVMWWLPRVLEGDSLLERLELIDKEIANRL
ncbi:hypothetical protein [Pedobacter helvus]|uniref:Uncharacterized protein n=1 Tax=Pedobacter helvus TaxID=2563444 RepID=A0ABW9JMJ4_9SPHI|nr:hypothetical protein [Pedobacter ureilyticus]